MSSEAFYADGRRAGLAGVPREQNPAQARPASTEGVPDSDELWTAKKEAWNRGWDEGTAAATARPTRARDAGD